MSFRHDEHDRIRAIAATDALTDRLAAVRERIAEHIVAAHVFAIPTQRVGEQVPPTGPVRPLTGDDAARAAQRALLRTEYDDEQHAKSTVRMPGIVQIDADWSDTVAAVNALKDDLQAAMQTLGYSAWLRLRTQIPSWQRLNRLQAYRDWRWVEQPMRRLSFTWAGHTRGGEQLRMAALIGRLQKQYDRYGIPSIQDEIDRLLGFDPDEVVVIRRPIAPTPIVNVLFADKARRSFKTSLPLLTHQPLPEISALRDFDPDRRTAARNDLVTEARPLNEHLHAYRHTAPHRFRLRADPVSVRMQWSGQDLAVVLAHHTITLPAPTPKALEHIIEAARDTRGPAAVPYAMGPAPAPVFVAANPAHVFVDAGDYGVWRVPKSDMKALRLSVFSAR